MHFLLLLCKLLAHGGWRARRSTSALCLPRPLFLRKAAADFSFGNEFLILHEMKPNVGRLNACWMYSLGQRPRFMVGVLNVAASRQLLSMR